MKLPVLLLVSLPRLGAAACTCKTTPTSPNQQATADNANAKFIADLSIVDYGFECKKHDEGKGLLCDVTDPPDYCAQPWCIVDEATCTDVKLRAVSYTADTTDKFSYEACETSFTGNSWVGYCKNCESPFELTSFCTCGGSAGCPCKKAAPQTTAATDKPAFVGDAGRSYGSGCKAHDTGLGDCKGKTDTANGEPNDWCLDEWCIVDRANCDVNDRAVSYTTAVDYFSFETCDTSFTGNSWVGYCKNCASPFELNSFCTCGGSAGCPCKKAAPQTRAADGKPEFVGDAGRSYGSGCKAHDTGLGDCKGKTDTAFNQPNDWCLDEWCIVDPSSCDVKDRAVSYTTATDYFSFETCDTSFSGNSWVGYCKTCTEASFKNNSYCKGTCTPVDASPTAAPETSGAKQFAIVTLAAISCIGSSLI